MKNTKVINFKFHIRHVQKKLKVEKLSENRGIILDQDQLAATNIEHLTLEHAYNVEYPTFENCVKAEDLSLSKKEEEVVNMYLKENKYGEIIKFDGIFYIKFLALSELSESEKLSNKKVIYLHIAEVVNEYRNYKDLLERNQIKVNACDKKLRILSNINIDNGLKIASFIRSAVYKKTNIKINEAAKYFQSLAYIKEEDVLKYIYFEKLVDMIVAKKNNIELSGASDVLDVKKTVNEIIKRLSNRDWCLFIRKCMAECEREFGISYKFTIIRKRIEKDLAHINCLIEIEKLDTKCLLSIYNNDVTTDTVRTLKRIKNICNKTVFSGKKSLEDIEEVFKNKCVDKKILLFIDFIESHILREFDMKSGELIKEIGEKIIKEKLTND